MRRILYIIVGCLIFITGCSSKMSKEQEEDRIASKVIKEAITSFKNAKNMHVVFTIQHNNTTNEIFDIHLSEKDFTGTHSYTDKQGKKVIHYDYKRGDDWVTYDPITKKVHKKQHGASILNLREKILFSAMSAIPDDIKDNYKAVFKTTMNKDETVSYTNTSVVFSNMKRAPTLILTKNAKVVGFIDEMGVSYKIDGYNTSKLAYSFLDTTEDYSISDDM